MIEEIYQCKKLFNDDVWRTKKGIERKFSGLTQDSLDRYDDWEKPPPHIIPIKIHWIVKEGNLSPLA